jgi:hypothetical protein
MTESFCILYSSSELDKEGLRIRLSDYLNLKRVSISSFASSYTLSVYINNAFDKHTQCQFPDGFLHFKFKLEFSFLEQTVNEFHVDVISKTLQWLWAQNIPTVASCDYEEKLPHNGGYKDATLPWPKLDEDIKF